MGINMPARTVLFTSARKFDGKDFRWVTVPAISAPVCVCVCVCAHCHVCAGLYKAVHSCFDVR